MAVRDSYHPIEMLGVISSSLSLAIKVMIVDKKDDR